ncbi:MAG: hypothetical protein PSV35_06975, partial [bacterium]|nr:hypothetical protein [bacterium]
AGVAVKIKDTIITAKTSGNSAAGANAQAYGVVNYSGSILSDGNTILAQSSGVADAGGSVNATGMRLGSSLTFTGSQSRVTAISNSSTGTSTATTGGNTVNPPATNAQCSINNGTGYQTCQ